MSARDRLLRERFSFVEGGKDRIKTLLVMYGEEQAGRLSVIQDRDGHHVAGIIVTPHFRGRGIATALYESAFDKACKSGVALYSDTSRSHFSEAFWRKQAKKGRAKCSARNPPARRISNAFESELNYWLMQTQNDCYREARFDRFAAARCFAKKKKGILSRLPKPIKTGHDAFAWPCLQWQLSTPCTPPVSLEGWPHRRR